MLKWLYRKASRLIPMDVTRVLLWNIDALAVPSPINSPLNVQMIGAVELSEWSGDPIYELSSDTVQSVDQMHISCVGAFSDNVLAGYIFFCDSPVDARQNSGGSQFTGIGLEFPTSVRYLYKAFVHPDYRGKRVAKELMLYAAAHFQFRSVKTIITTTDWTNTAFLQATKSVQFESVAMAGEMVLFGKSRYKIPEDISVDGTTRQVIRFVNP